MRRILLAICLLTFLPLIAQAYTLVLKDGRRFEVREQYRIVNDIAVFSMPDGSRFSISLEKINVSATELANGVETGMFVKGAVNPPKTTDKAADNKNDKSAQTIEDDNQLANSRPASHKLTNSDFDRYRIRREEMSRDASDRAAAKAAAQIGAQSAGITAAAAVAPVQTEAEKEAARENQILADRRENEKKREEYWRTRSRALLTQMRVEEEQISILATEIDSTNRTPYSPPLVSVYNQPNYPYNYPSTGVRIGGIPIGIGGVGGVGHSTGGGNVVVINNQDPNQQRGQSLQDRLITLQLQHQATLVQYDEMCEEARRDGALPGWLR